jgi:PKHD-type hydroxylase
VFYLFPRIIKPEVCDRIIENCKDKNLASAKVLDAGASSARDDPDIRKTLIHFVPTDRSDEANTIAWHLMKEANTKLFKYDLTYFQNIQFGEYKDGGFYDWHTDSYLNAEPNKTRKLSLSLMLTDPDTFTGGEFQFYNGGRPFAEQGDIDDKELKKDLKAKGSVVVFDSRDFHRVTPVTHGVRYSVVCWATGANFK